VEGRRFDRARGGHPSSQGDVQKPCPESAAEALNVTVVESAKEVPLEKWFISEFEIVELFLGPTDSILPEVLISSWHNHQKYQ
jgi:hypothetical protein